MHAAACVVLTGLLLGACGDALPSWYARAEVGASQAELSAAAQGIKAGLLGISAAVTPKKCPPKLTKAALLARTALVRSYSAAGRPDPECKTGVVSLPGTPKPDGPQVCCPAYCGECADYPTCASVKGQASE